MSVERFRFVFRMELARYKIRMRLARQLNHFHKFPIRRYAAKNEAFFFQDLAKSWVEFITVPMSLADLFGSIIYTPGERTFFQRTLPVAQTHRAAVFADIDEIAKFENNWKRRFFVKLGRIGI